MNEAKTTTRGPESREEVDDQAIIVDLVTDLVDRYSTDNDTDSVNKSATFHRAHQLGARPDHHSGLMEVYIPNPPAHERVQRWRAAIVFSFPDHETAPKCQITFKTDGKTIIRFNDEQTTGELSPEEIRILRENLVRSRDSFVLAQQE